LCHVAWLASVTGTELWYKSIMRNCLILVLSLYLSACAGQATLLPQGDHSLKVIAQGPSIESARRSAESEATKACRKTQQVYDLQSETNAVVDSTEPGATEYRVIWRFNCIDRAY